MDEYLKTLTDALTRIAVALEAIAAGGKSVGAVAIEMTSPKPEPAKAEAVEDKKPAAKAEDKKPPAEEPKAEEPADDKPEFTIDQIRTALKEYRAIEGTAAMMEILKVHGKADSVQAVDPANFAAIMEAIEAA